MIVTGARQLTTSRVAMVGNPFGQPSSIMTSGVPIGIYLRTGEPFYFDPVAAKMEGLIPSTSAMVLGGVGSGKSTVMKCATIAMAMIGSNTTIAVNDHKNEGGTNEYAALAEFLGCDAFDIATRRINPFEPALQLGDLSVLEMAMMLCEHSSHERLRGADLEALKIGVFVMRQSSELLWSIQSLLKICQSLDSSNIHSYYTDMHNRMRGQLDNRVRRLGLDQQEQDAHLSDLAGIYERPNNLNVSVIIDSGREVANILSSLLEGRYGSMLGGDDSLYEVLSARAVIKDWRGVSADAVSLMRAIDYWVQVNAIEKGLTRLYPRVVVDDEDHESMKNITYARATAYLLKVMRSAQMVRMCATHRLSDYRQGGAGSELSGYGQSIINDTSFFIVGRQVGDQEVLDELRARLDISKEAADGLAHLPARVFAVKCGEGPLRYVQMLPPSMVQQLIETNSATTAMATRPGLDPSHFAAVSRETGFPLRREV